MNLLITGGSGLVGWDLIQRAEAEGHQVTYTYHSTDHSIMENTSAEALQLDIRETERVREVVTQQDPDAIVHAAAMTDVDACEQHPEKAKNINVLGTKHVVSACEETDTELLFLSTGFVFDGDGDKFVEEDPRHAVNQYGQTKIEAEDAVMDSPLKATICRIDQPYCWPTHWQKETFVTWVLNRCEAENPFPVFTDWYNTPVYVPDCNRTVLKLLMSDNDGVYHVVGPNFTSRYDWARLIADVFGYDPDLIKEGHSKDANLPAPRPNNHLSNRKIRQVIDIEFDTLEEGLDRMGDSEGGVFYCSVGVG